MPAPALQMFEFNAQGIEKWQKSAKTVSSTRGQYNGVDEVQETGGRVIVTQQEAKEGNIWAKGSIFHFILKEKMKANYERCMYAT